ncbi:MAG: sigma-54 dependent transcriptional regulator [Myxococcota bacterium]|nr:sigma-54 dependent transcriptional regulator [Myxococcota bacterium]
MEHQLEPETCQHCGLLPHVVSARKHGRMVCESPAMQELLRRVARFAASDAPVVVLGESGTGKEVVARALHVNGERAARPFVAVNVAALSSELLESELFGHARGAFTGAHQARTGLFESADGGTLFLDEMGEMPLQLQAKLLRVLQEGEVRRVGESRPVPIDVRVVCATHRDLQEQVREGLFREDLYYRLKVLTLTVAPLRERALDILPLARQFLTAELERGGQISPAAEAVLLAHRWPGNVRELQNTMRHCAALLTGDRVEPGDLPEELLRTRLPVASSLAPDRVLRPLAEVEREHILAVMDATGGVTGEAARILGIGRNTLWRKLKQLA